MLTNGVSWLTAMQFLSATHAVPVSNPVWPLDNILTYRRTSSFWGQESAQWCGDACPDSQYTLNYSRPLYPHDVCINYSRNEGKSVIFGFCRLIYGHVVSAVLGSWGPLLAVARGMGYNETAAYEWYDVTILETSLLLEDARSRNSTVGIVNRLRTGRRRSWNSITGRGKAFFSSR
jgi:hypothetical protein